MPAFYLVALAVLALLSACYSSSDFDPQVWQANAAMTDPSYPRARMVQDLVTHHLQPGMTRAAVLTLLGPPYKDGVENRLPKYITMPDTVGAIRPALYRPKTGGTCQRPRSKQAGASMPSIANMGGLIRSCSIPWAGRRSIQTFWSLSIRGRGA